MTLSEISIRRPVFAWMIMFALMFFSVICFMQLGVSQLPEATPPKLTITVSWVGAATGGLETQIVNPIEEAGLCTQGIPDVESTMREAIAFVELTFRSGMAIDS